MKKTILMGMLLLTSLFSVNGQGKISAMTSVAELDTNAYFPLIQGTPFVNYRANISVIGASIVANNAWGQTGNTGTDPNNNFCGTADSVPFLIGANSDLACKYFPNGDMLLQRHTVTNNITGSKIENITGDWNNTSENYYHFANTQMIIGAINPLENRSQGYLVFENTGRIQLRAGKKDGSTYPSIEIKMQIDTNESAILKQGLFIDSTGTRVDSSLWVNGSLQLGSADSATIYATTPPVGTVRFCTDCTGSGVTGRIVSYFGATWRRLRFD